MNESTLSEQVLQVSFLNWIRGRRCAVMAARVHHALQFVVADDRHDAGSVDALRLEAQRGELLLDPVGFAVLLLTQVGKAVELPVHLAQPVEMAL